MKTILIPTDYQASSLDGVHSVCRQLKNEELNLVFVHLFKLSDSYNDLLMLSRRSREYEKVSDEFYRYYNVLRAQYPQIRNVKIEFLYGSTLSMFRNFIEANEIELIVENEEHQFMPIHASSVDPSLLIQRSGLPLLVAAKLQMNARVKQPQKAVVEQQELLEV